MYLAEINEVIKASPAIQIQSKITHLQRRAWNVLLANAYNELPNTDIYSVSVAELSRKLGFNSHNEDYLKETLEALVDCTVEWNILGKDNKQEWGVASLLASAKIKDGICTYGFAPHLRLQLHNPRIYTKLNLRLQNQFTSKYALVLSKPPRLKPRSFRSGIQSRLLGKDQNVHFFLDVSSEIVV